MTPPLWLSIGLTIFFAAATLRLVGFGGGMIGMSLLAPLLGTIIAAPLMSLIGVVNTGVALVHLRHSLSLRDVWRIVAAMITTIPLGVISLNYLPETFLLGAIGAMCIIFALYRALSFPLPSVNNLRWGYLAGLFGGFMGGAVNIPAVPIIFYAETQEWEVNRYRINLFTIFFSSTLISVVSRLLTGQFTQQILLYWLQALPFLFAGQVVGYTLTHYVNQSLFRKLILVVIFTMGVRILL